MLASTGVGCVIRWLLRGLGIIRSLFVPFFIGLHDNENETSSCHSVKDGQWNPKISPHIVSEPCSEIQVLGRQPNMASALGCLGLP